MVSESGQGWHVEVGLFDILSALYLLRGLRVTVFPAPGLGLSITAIHHQHTELPLHLGGLVVQKDMSKFHLVDIGGAIPSRKTFGSQEAKQFQSLGRGRFCTPYPGHGDLILAPALFTLVSTLKLPRSSLSFAPGQQRGSTELDMWGSLWT